MLTFEYGNINHQQLLFDWANDEDTRRNSYSNELIEWENHVKWLNGRLKDEFCKIYIFKFGEVPCGMVRIESSKDEYVIGISVSKDFRGKGLSASMIQIATEDYLKQINIVSITAYVKDENVASQKAFERAGYSFLESVMINNKMSKKYGYGI